MSIFNMKQIDIHQQYWGRTWHNQTQSKSFVGLPKHMGWISDQFNEDKNWTWDLGGSFFWTNMNNQFSVLENGPLQAAQPDSRKVRFKIGLGDLNRNGMAFQWFNMTRNFWMLSFDSHWHVSWGSLFSQPTRSPQPWMINSIPNSCSIWWWIQNPLYPHRLISQLVSSQWKNMEK